MLSALSAVEGLIQNGYEVHAIFSAKGPAIHLFETLNIQIHLLPHLNWLRRTAPLKFIYDSYREYKRAKEFETLYRQISPDLIYINTSVSFSAAVAANRMRIPSVWHIREMFQDVGGEMKAPLIFKPIVKYLFSILPTKLIVNAKAVSDNMLNNEGQAKAEVIPIGIRDQFFVRKHLSTIKLDEESIFIGVPGTLRPAKGHVFFLNAVAPILRKHQNIKVLITGDGHPKFLEHLKAQVRNLGIDDRVSFLGTVVDMPAFYKLCDLIVVPSASESFGRTVVEAMASEVAIVATAVGGITEIIDDQVNGLLVAYEDEDGLRHAIATLISDKEMRSALAGRAMAKAKTLYTEAMYQRKLLSVIEEVIRPR
ncbi:MAG TPA: glycosyltransferase family 4 protein [Saprospiraceae bacterium]|nr:glycosyltransferase family 4 protein [Saprospiraceae bacterium]